MAKIPWQKYMFADHISDHVLFIIMTCSETVCYSSVFALDIFSSFSTLKTARRGEEANEKMVFCVYMLPQKAI